VEQRKEIARQMIEGNPSQTDTSIARAPRWSYARKLVTG
jgi:hypothetical protein